MSGTADIYADHEDGIVALHFSGGNYLDDDTGETVTVPPTEVTLQPAVALEMAYRITVAAYALMGDNIDEDQP